MRNCIGWFKNMLLLSLVLFVNVCIAQKNKFVYQDENNRTIGLLKFNDKVDSKLFFSLVEIKQDSIIKSLRFKEFFGELESNERDIIQKIAEEHTLNTKNVWLIHYLDSLPNVSYMPQVSGLYIHNRLESKIAEKIKSKRFYHFAEDSLLISHKDYWGYVKSIRLNYLDYKKIIPQESKRYSKKMDVELVHFYNINKGYPEKDIINENLIHDKEKEIKNIFNSKLLDDYHIIVLYPDGRYYKTYSRELFIKMKNKLLKNKSFTKMKKKWEQNINELN